MANKVHNQEARALLEEAGLTPDDLSRLTGTATKSMPRWWPKAGPLAIPAYAMTIITAWPHMPDEVKRRLLGGDG